MNKNQWMLVFYLVTYSILARFLWVFGSDHVNASEWRLWKEIDLFFFSVGGGLSIIIVLGTVHVLWLVASEKI
tara:strand:- start:217 stop:435 length:219 start_codon:yes stop_codon:yes gene_type:complete